jgi:hypothetical protein
LHHDFREREKGTKVVVQDDDLDKKGGLELDALV